MGDYTRDTFRPSRNFSSVRQQQGRVHLDADWNESIDIAQHIERTTVRDVVGPTGMPEEAPGFAIAPVPASPGADLIVGTGRAYVDGLLIEYETEASELTLISGAGVAAIWEVSKGPRLEAGQWLGREPNPSASLTQVKTIEPDAQGDNGRQRLMFETDLGAGPTVTVRAFASVAHQPHLPGTTLPAQNGTYLAYLDVWEREITALEDDFIAETALNGPDTALRTQVIWQLKVMSLNPLINSGAIPAHPTCKAFPAGWSPDPGAPVLLVADAHQENADENPCDLPERGGFRSLSNQLYRVEVHTPVAGSNAVMLKWSRDNGIFRSRLLDVVNGSLVVEDIGNDKATAFATDEWLEIRDEGQILRGEPGHFVELGEIVGTRLGIRTILHPITLQPVVQNGAPDASVLPRRGVVRRWEGGEPKQVDPSVAFKLEHGIEVTIPDTGGVAVAGMYWLIPARTLTASIEWPADEATGAPAAMPPHGVHHAYCPVAVLTKNNQGWTVSSDCRPIFPPLTQIEDFSYLGGDGQEAMPDLTQPQTPVPVESPLRVGVTRGRHPVKGRAVRFRVVDAPAASRLTLAIGDAVAGATPVELVILTDANGIAAANLSISAGRAAHHVTAELLDSTDPAQAAPVRVPIAFTATASLASAVAFNPANCAYQSSEIVAPGISKTVQEAIDKLCPRLEFLPLGGDSQTLCVGKVAPQSLRAGLFWGRQSLEGVKVEFNVIAGDASVSPQTALTNAEGIAEVQIIAGSDPFLNDGLVTIEARANGPIGSSPGVLIFGARFLQAACVYGGNGGGGADDKAIHVKSITLYQDRWEQRNVPITAHSVVFTGDLAAGIVYELDHPINPKCLGGLTGAVFLDTRIFPIGEDEVELLWGGNDDRPLFIGANQMRLDGAVYLYVDEGGNERTDMLHFRFWDRVVEWLAWRTERPGKAAEYIEKLRLAALPIEAVLYGNRIYDTEGDDELYLDGNLFLSMREQNGVRYPSGDGKRGGDLVLPFFLGKDA